MCRITNTSKIGGLVFKISYDDVRKTIITKINAVFMRIEYHTYLLSQAYHKQTKCKLSPIVGKKIERLILMNTTQTIAQKDIDIILAHKEQFSKPLITLAELSRLDLPKQELMTNHKFKEAISELRDIESQGHKRQLLLFTDMVYNTDIF